MQLYTERRIISKQSPVERIKDKDQVQINLANAN